MSASASNGGPIRYDKPRAARALLARRLLYGTFTLVVSIVVGLAVVDGLGGLPVYGANSANVEATRADLDLRVHYPRVARGQLDSALRLDLHRSGGFADPVTIAVSTAYLDLFTTNNLSPEPTTETQSDRTLELTFEPPRSDTLVISWDLSVRPSTWFDHASGEVTVLGADGRPAVSVTIETEVRP